MSAWPAQGLTWSEQLHSFHGDSICLWQHQSSSSVWIWSESAQEAHLHSFHLISITHVSSILSFYLASVDLWPLGDHVNEQYLHQLVTIYIQICVKMFDSFKAESHQMQWKYWPHTDSTWTLIQMISEPEQRINSGFCDKRDGHKCHVTDTSWPLTFR